MSKFTDTTSIRIKAGNGGPGAVSFHREKFIAKGGPDGGDGGKGGDVYIKADIKLYNLSHIFKERLYKGENGHAGMSNNRHGRDGDDLTIRVPAGTQIIDPETDEVLVDLLDDQSVFLAGSGGIGGKGNAFFKSSTFQTPRFSQPGMPGDEKRIVLNLKLIADIGLVGLPNAGKSTLLSKITNARPKIANYPFTTLIPNLGVFQSNDGTLYKIADIPGIIEGAHKGLGLGLSFLQHIERVRAILFIIDITGDDLAYTLTLLKSEISTYNAELTTKPYYVLLNKIDLVDDDTVREKTQLMGEKNVLAISASTDVHMDRLIAILGKLMENERAS